MAQTTKQETWDGTVDLVYLWVDGDDPVWRRKYDLALGKNPDESDENVGKCRYTDNDELRYSLRSVAQGMAWVRRIYIVTDGQTPVWLNTENEKIRVVDHRDFIPADCLPLYNSSAIETFIHRIEGLAEHFIYANDDMLVGRRLDRSFFFTREGKPIARLRRKAYTDDIAEAGYYDHVLRRSQRLAEQACGKALPYIPHHNMDAYTKTLWEEITQRYAEEYALARQNRFRAPGDIERNVVLLYGVGTGACVLREVGRDRWYKRIGRALVGQSADSITYHVHGMGTRAGYRFRMNHTRVGLLCLNDDARTTEADRRAAARWMGARWGEKCEFEK